MKPKFIAFNAFFERYVPIFTPVSLILGFFFAKDVQPFVAAVPYLFMYMMFVTALGCEWPEVRRALRKPGPFAWTFAAAHVALPAAAYAAGSLVYGASSPYVTGLVLFALIPLGVTSIIWVGMAGGQVALALAFVVADTVLSPFVVPGALHLLFGGHVEFDTRLVMRDLALIVVLPTLAGLLVNHWSKGGGKRHVQPYLTPLSKLVFLAVLLLNASAIQPYLQDLKGDLPGLALLSAGLIAVAYGTGYLSRRWFGASFDDRTYSFTLGMRNISLGVVIALHYFEPLAAVPVILSTLLQQPFASINFALLRRATLRSTLSSRESVG